MRRYSVSDEFWSSIRGVLPVKGTSSDKRLFVDALVWVAKSGAPWRDLPSRIGKWNTVYQRFRRWSRVVYGSRSLSAVLMPISKNCSWTPPP